MKKSLVMSSDRTKILKESCRTVGLHHRCTHSDYRLDRWDGILRIVSPVAAMRNHHYILGVRIIDLSENLLGTGSILWLLCTRNREKSCTGNADSAYNIYFQVISQL